MNNAVLVLIAKSLQWVNTITFIRFVDKLLRYLMQNDACYVCGFKGDNSILR